MCVVKLLISFQTSPFGSWDQMSLRSVCMASGKQKNMRSSLRLKTIMRLARLISVSERHFLKAGRNMKFSE
jgi:hypothetical protein